MSVRITNSERIHGVSVVSFQKFEDARGRFFETYRQSWLPDAPRMVQGNCSHSRAGVLRGLHYHLRQADYWFVAAGRVRAALYDLRQGSPTQGAAHVLELRADDPAGLYIPRGVAHGFVALEDTVMSYLVDVYYDDTDELGVMWNDPALGVDWGVEAPVLSPRDARNPLLADIAPARRPVFGR